METFLEVILRNCRVWKSYHTRCVRRGAGDKPVSDKRQQRTARWRSLWGRQV